nr:hypothetical protein [Tanacetum cinerariifolium]
MPNIITTSATDPPSSPSSTPPRCHHPPISPQPPSLHHLLLATTKGCVGFAEAPPRGSCILLKKVSEYPEHLAAEGVHGKRRHGGRNAGMGRDQRAAGHNGAYSLAAEESYVSLI